MSVTIILDNNDPFGNNVRVKDVNANDALIFDAFIEAHATEPVACQANDSGYANIATSIDQHDWVGRSFLKDGEYVRLY